MARPTKSITTRTGHMSKLNLQQKKHFRTIVDYLKEAEECIIGLINI